MRFIVQTSPLFDIISLLFQDYTPMWLVSLKYVTVELVSTSHENVHDRGPTSPTTPSSFPSTAKCGWFLAAAMLVLMLALSKGNFERYAIKGLSCTVQLEQD